MPERSSTWVRPESRWVQEGDEWIAVCPPFFEFDYDEERFDAAIREGRRRFFNRPPVRSGLIRFGCGPKAAR